MTDRTEIERLLNMTGRTLAGLQTEDQMFDDPKYHEKIDEYFKARSAVSYDWPHTFGLYQSQMIELLIGALRDALDKPMQKPMTLQEAIDFKDITYLEIKRLVEDIDKVYVFPIGIDETNHNFDQMTAYYVIGRTNGNYLDNHGYNVYWRCWASRPTDEEREAAEWES